MPTARIVKYGIAILFFILISTSVYLGYKYVAGESECKINLSSDSSVIKIQLTDKNKFENYIKKYIQCDNGFFVVGDPIFKKEYKLKNIKFNITDTPQLQKVTTGRTKENPQDEGVLVYSYGFYLDPSSSEAVIYLNLTKEVFNKPSFDNYLVFTLAAMADHLKNYNKPQEVLLKTGSLQDFNFPIEEIGITYEKLN